MKNIPAFRIDPNSPTPIVRQIVDGIRVQLVEGELPPGTELPSVRRTAIELGVHFNTVAEAYRQLAVEGWLDLRHGRAATVIERVSHAITTKADIDDCRRRLRELVSQMRARGISPAKIALELRSILKGLQS